MGLFSYAPPLVLIDLPFSLALDTALLPFTVWGGFHALSSYSGESAHPDQ